MAADLAKLNSQPPNMPSSFFFNFDTVPSSVFAAFTNKPSIDAPDRAALEANPLAIAGL